MQQISTEGVQGETRLGRQGDPLANVQKIPARRPDLIIINKRKRICKIVDFAVPVDHRINLKVSEKKDKCLKSGTYK